MTDLIKGRVNPCGSCPYRRNVPSGVWHEEEYMKLPAYDNEMAEQPTSVFMCHQGDGKACAGWLGYRDPYDLLAVRLSVATGRMDPSCMNYTGNANLFDSGAEAAAHGMRDMENPSPAAMAVMGKIERKREAK